VLTKQNDTIRTSAEIRDPTKSTPHSVTCYHRDLIFSVVPFLYSDYLKHDWKVILPNKGRYRIQYNSTSVSMLHADVYGKRTHYFPKLFALILKMLLCALLRYSLLKDNSIILKMFVSCSEFSFPP